MKAGTPADPDGAAGAEGERAIRSDDPDVAWRAIDRRKRKQERKISAGQAAEFRRQGAEAVRRFNAEAGKRDYKHITATMILDFSAMLEGHLSELSGPVRDAVRAGWATAASRISLDVPVDMDDARIRRVLDELNAKMRGVVETTMSQVNDLLQKGMKDGYTTQQMAAAINSKFQQYSIVRSQIIAQTSGTAAFESAQSAAYKRGGVQKKQWLTQRDGAVRPAHIVADLQTVDIDGSFDVDGEPLEYPGDPGGSAGNVINCRCSMLPVISDDEQ